MLLGLLGMSGQGLALVVTSGITALAGAKWLFGRDEAREDRKREMIEVAGKLTSEGFVKIPAIIIDMAVGDYSSIVHKLKGVLDDLRTPEGRLALSDELFTKQLAARMNDAKRRPEIEKAMETFKTIKESTDAKVVASATNVVNKLGS